MRKHIDVNGYVKMKATRARNVILFLLACICGAVAIIYVVREIDVKITNIGFAVMAALTSICFSWVRTFEGSQFGELKRKIRKHGQTAFLAAINFCIASLIKYGGDLLKAAEGGKDTALILLQTISAIFCFFAFFGLVIVLFQLFCTICFEVSETQEPTVANEQD